MAPFGDFALPLDQQSYVAIARQRSALATGMPYP
jgi:hypothetical protein